MTAATDGTRSRAGLAEIPAAPCTVDRLKRKKPDTTDEIGDGAHEIVRALPVVASGSCS